MGMCWGGWSGMPSRASAAIASTAAANHWSERVMLRKPGPLTSTDSAIPSRSSWAVTMAATSRGGIPTFLARASGALACRSANCEGRSTGSACRSSG
jgi:hypothetical protein